MCAAIPVGISSLLNSFQRLALSEFPFGLSRTFSCVWVACLHVSSPALRAPPVLFFLGRFLADGGALMPRTKDGAGCMHRSPSC